MKEIKLTQGKVALVDDEDFEWLSQWKWYAHWEKQRWYAMRDIRSDRKKHAIRMHRAILERHGYDLLRLDVDHKNNDGLDNRLSNLRPVTRSQNNQNRHRVYGTSKYKGVYWFSRTQKWQAYIGPRCNKIHLGYFEDEKAAAKAYNQSAMKFYKEYAHLNEV